MAFSHSENTGVGSTAAGTRMPDHGPGRGRGGGRPRATTSGPARLAQSRRRLHRAELRAGYAAAHRDGPAKAAIRRWYASPGLFWRTFFSPSTARTNVWIVRSG